MSSTAMNQQHNQILSILAAAEHGLKISEIESQLQITITRRTLGRRLQELEAQGKVLISGERSATKYYHSSKEQGLRLSEAGMALKGLVLRPLSERNPVPYQPEFLLSYQPNETYYLTQNMREHLQHIGQPFNQALEPNTYVKRILHRLLIDLSWNSSRLEGNTYSLLETIRLLEFGAEAEGRNLFEAQMILNHKDAIEFMVAQASEFGLNRYVVLNIHALLSNNLLNNPKARGQLRQIPVGIGKTNYYPLEIPQLIDDYFLKILDTANKISDPFEQSFFLMVHLPYLQPFEDVNKRVSRLVANIPLIRNNLSPLSFIDVPKSEYIDGLLAIYELNRIELLRDIYLWSYERSAQHYKVIQHTISEPDPIRFQFQKELVLVIQHIVMSHSTGKAIIEIISNWSEKHIPEANRTQFIEIAENEIVSLHEGNIAVYGIGLDDFAKWQQYQQNK